MFFRHALALSTDYNGQCFFFDFIFQYLLVIHTVTKKYYTDYVKPC